MVSCFQGRLSEWKIKLITRQVFRTLSPKNPIQVECLIWAVGIVGILLYIFASRNARVNVAGKFTSPLNVEFIYQKDNNGS